MGFLTMAPFAVVVLVVAATVLQVDSLKCYQCINCNTVSSQQLLTCNITLPDLPGTVPPAVVTDPPATETDPPAAATDPPAVVTDPPAAATDPPAAATDPPTQTDALIAQEFRVSRVKRSILDDNLEGGLFDDDCFCNNEYCNCGGRIFFSSYDDIKVVNLTLVCVTDTVTINGTAITNRGCGVKANTTELSCSLSNYSQNCKICETDGCNSLAISLQFSSILLIPVFIASFVK